MKYQRSDRRFLSLLFGSLGTILLLWLVLDSQRSGTKSATQELLVYCAAGIRLPVEEAARQFEEEVGIKIRLEYDSSGGLEGKLKLDRENSAPRADVYIPADLSFADRARENNLTAEVVPLAKFHLVLGVAPEFDKPVAQVATYAV